MVLLATIILFYFLKCVGFSGSGVGGIFIYVSHFLGYPLYVMRGELSVNYPDMSETIYHIGIGYSLIGFLGYVLTVILFKYNRSPIDEKPNIPKLKYNILCIIYLLLFIIGSVLYVQKNGISFGGDYANRLEANSGNGFYLMAMFSFIPSVILLALNGNKNKAYIIAIICGLLYFFIVGGSRNILAAALVAITFIAYKNGQLKKGKMIFLGFVVIMLMNILVFTRYSLSFDSMSMKSVIALILSYTADSFSPLDFQSIAVNYYTTDYNPQIQGITLFLNQFSAFVPRFLWPDKPIVIMNNSYYFTTHILGLHGNLNMAPTMLGSSMVMFGQYGFFLVYILGGFFMKAIDLFTVSKFLVLRIIGYMSIPFVFFMTREGLDLYVFIVFKFSIVVFFGYILSSVIIFILPKNKINSRK